MTLQTNEIAPDTDDLDAFESLMFGQTQPAQGEVTEAPPQEEEATREVEPATPEDIEPEDFEEEEIPEEKPKKSRYQERLDEITAARREAERQRDETQRLLEEALKKIGKPEPTPDPVVTKVPVPVSPDATNPDGTPKYPLGEFDPAYVADLSEAIVQQKLNDFLSNQEAERAKQEKARAEQAQAQEWAAKVEAVKDRLPDFQDKVQALSQVAASVPNEVGDALAAALSKMEYGPDVLYELGSNPAEAARIFKMDPVSAAVALGRIEARHALASEEKTNKIKVSSAPPPPASLNKGSAPAIDIPDDTDDLDAFEQKFFKRKR